MDYIIKISDLKKRYRLGQIGATTLTAELQSWWAKRRGKEDPNLKIGVDHSKLGKSFYALNGIDLEINDGERVGIIGRNGAGKSTMLKLLCRVTAPTEGEIRVRGRITSMLEVGTGFNAEMTGRENIYLNGAILGMTAEEIDEKMDAIIDFSECADFIDTPVKRYSSGMYVRLAFAVAAHLNSDILVMDEVLAVGDLAFQQKCLKKMRALAEDEGKTILYVSHNMSTIRQLCSRCVVLSSGKIVFDGSVEEAISVYAESSGTASHDLDLSEMTRPGNMTQRVRMLRMKTVDREDTFFVQGERLKVLLEYEPMEAPLSGVMIQVVIKSVDGISLGVALSERCLEIEEVGVSRCELNIDTSFLTEGQYCIDLYMTRSDGISMDHVDRLLNIFMFEIIQHKENTNLLTQPKYRTGKIVFPEIGLKEF